MLLVSSIVKTSFGNKTPGFTKLDNFAILDSMILIPFLHIVAVFPHEVSFVPWGRRWEKTLHWNIKFV